MAFLRMKEVERSGDYLVNLLHYEDAASLSLAVCKHFSWLHLHCLGSWSSLMAYRNRLSHSVMCSCRFCSTASRRSLSGLACSLAVMVSQSAFR